jgi:hypothetical protein
MTAKSKFFYETPLVHKPHTAASRKAMRERKLLISAKAKDGRNVAVKRRNHMSPNRLSFIGWWRPLDFQPIYDTHTKILSRGDFTEEEIRAMELRYGAPIKRPGQSVQNEMPSR